MSEALQNRAKNPLMRVKSAVMADDSKAVQIMRVHDAIMAELAQMKAPFLTPDEIAPRLGIKPNSFRVYCRATKSLRKWKGSYRFMQDDPQHLQAVSDVIFLALWSMQRLPEVQRVKAH